MNWKTALIAVLIMVGSAAVMFQFFQRQLSGASFTFGSHPEVLAELEASLDDQKALAELDPEHERRYRERFDRLETTVHRLQILEHNREDLQKRYETILLLIFGVSVVVVTGIYALRQSRHAPRLARLQHALTALAEGRTDLDVGVRGRDTISRIGAMIERTSRVMARDRRRLAALKNLSAWQEAARRHAHEMRTPLTSARLELQRMQDLLAKEDLDQRDLIHRASDGAQQELDRLGAFTRQFTSFARLPQPELVRRDLGQLLEEFVSTYQTAWPNLRLDLEVEESAEVSADRDMVRQVLVNLCDNSSLALAQRQGTVSLRLEGTPKAIHLDISDDGPGIAPDIRSRIFEPYTTTRTIGEGMGLGLAICKKILLDHDGDLELLTSSSSGSTFRLTMPRAGTDAEETA